MSGTLFFQSLSKLVTTGEGQNKELSGKISLALWPGHGGPIQQLNYCSRCTKNDSQFHHLFQGENHGVRYQRTECHPHIVGDILLQLDKDLGLYSVKLVGLRRSFCLYLTLVIGVGDVTCLLWRDQSNVHTMK